MAARCIVNQYLAVGMRGSWRVLDQAIASAEYSIFTVLTKFVSYTIAGISAAVMSDDQYKLSDILG
jgi:hypothetical protein